MPFLNSKNRYGSISLSMHWVMAIIAIALYALGLYIEDLSYYDSAYQWAPLWHNSLGIILGALLVLRLAWHRLSPVPQALPQVPLLILISKIVHWSLYLLLALLVMSGYLIVTEKGDSVSVFNWFEIVALPFTIPMQQNLIENIHEISADLMIFLTALHALAAFKHHFINRDATLKRMLGKTEDKQ